MHAMLSAPALGASLAATVMAAPTPAGDGVTFRWADAGLPSSVDVTVVISDTTTGRVLRRNVLAISEAFVVGTHELYEGDLGWSLTGFQHHTLKKRTAYYPAQRQVQSSSAFGEIGQSSRDGFLPTRPARELAAGGGRLQASVEDGLRVFRYADPRPGGPTNAVGIDEAAGVIRWFKRFAPDGTTTLDITYGDWRPVGDGHWPYDIRVVRRSFDGTIYHETITTTSADQGPPEPPPMPDLPENIVILDLIDNVVRTADGEVIDTIAEYQSGNSSKSNGGPPPSVASIALVGGGTLLTAAAGWAWYRRRRAGGTP